MNKLRDRIFTEIMKSFPSLETMEPEVGLEETV